MLEQKSLPTRQSFAFSLFAELPPPTPSSSADEGEDMLRVLEEAVTEAFEIFGPEVLNWDIGFAEEMLWASSLGITPEASGEEAGKPTGPARADKNLQQHFDAAEQQQPSASPLPSEDTGFPPKAQQALVSVEPAVAEQPQREAESSEFEVDWLLFV